MSNPLLVAADGGRCTSAALRFAAAQSKAEGRRVEVIAVVDPLSDLPMPLPHREELEHAHAEGVVERVRQEVRRELGSDPCSLRICRGRAAPFIARHADELGACLVVLGVEGSEGGQSTAVELLHLAEAPVLVMRENGAPRSALVAVDFRRPSLQAARRAATLMGPAATLHLLHVRPPLDFPAAAVWHWGDRYSMEVERAFAELSAELRAKDAAAVHVHVRSGDPVTQVLKLLAELPVGLLAIGSDGYMCNGRAVVGRVARRLLAESPVAVLATPVALAPDVRGMPPAPQPQGAPSPG